MCNREVDGASASEAETATDMPWKQIRCGGSARGAISRLLGACLPLILLGVSSGVACPCYLASVGYFQARFQSELLFTHQVAVVAFAHFAAMLIEELCTRRRPALHSVLRRRVAVFSALAAATLAHVPACNSRGAVLLHGALISAFGTWLFGASMQIAASRGGVVLSNTGFGIGSVVAAFLVSVCRLGPTASVAAAYAFYSLAAAICVVGSWLWLWILGAFSGSLPVDERLAHGGDWDDIEDSSEPSEGRNILTGEYADQENAPGYAALAAAGGGARGARGARGWAPWEGAANELCGSGACGAFGAAAGIFCCHAAGFVLLPLLPLAGAEAATMLHQLKCLGEGLGRLAAVVHSADCAAAGRVGPRARGSLLAVALLARPAIALPVVAWLLAAGQRSRVAVAPQWLVLMLLVGIFCMGSYCALMLDLDAQLSARPNNRRCVVQWNRFVMILGHGLGLAVGAALAMY